ncbi:uncharacterized protein LOC142325131 isoform X2 [Lycorma delicatula]|uniref:uncharacterized protein LOC142325131 isoform X2 n=1 Tax=Lycorma delicatula TaxID=130591 RepID=UPI003F51A7D6
MEKYDNRQRLTVRGTSPAKTYRELNGGGQEVGGKSRTKKKIKKHSLQSSHKDWLNDPLTEFQAGSCWVPQGQQRLFTAISDPAVCGYPMSLSYSIDQFSLPMFPVYHASPLPHKTPYKPSLPTVHKQRRSRNHEKVPQGVDEFTSLPPVNITDFESDHQRRFSDPGLANGPLSDEESGSGDEFDDISSNESQLADRLSQVIKDNKRLETELQETKLQLQELKMEMTELKQIRSDCEPGVVSDLVRDVREAMKIHQEAFLSRLHMSYLSNAANKTVSKDCEDLKKKLKEVTSDRDLLHERLTRLEEQVKTVMVHNSVQESNQQELVILENEKLQLRRELQEAVDARKAAEAKVQNFEQLLSVLQKKMPNGLVSEEKSRSDHPSERCGGITVGGGSNGSSNVGIGGGVGGGNSSSGSGGGGGGSGGGGGGGPSSGTGLLKTALALGIYSYYSSC